MTPERKAAVLAAEGPIREYHEAAAKYYAARDSMVAATEAVSWRLLTAWSTECVNDSILAFCAKERGEEYEMTFGYLSILDDGRVKP